MEIGQLFRPALAVVHRAVFNDGSDQLENNCALDIELKTVGLKLTSRLPNFIDKVLMRITVIGAAYLAIICLIPELLISYAAMPFYFGGTSLLIVVSVTMDTVAQIHGHLQAHQYEGLVRKAKLRGKRK